MSITCGIVGLPNVGKSTLFNALTQTAAAQAANYPFCTIEPNVGKVAVPDERLDKLAKIAESAKIIPNQIEFVDIAGLVKGASKGEGLGNKFLSHIREVDVIVYVLRCFEDGEITHVEGSVDPIRDAEIIETELMIADLESLEKRIPNLEKKSKTDKEAKITFDLIQKILPLLKQGKPARFAEYTKDEEKYFRMLQLLTSKPAMYVSNMNEDEVVKGNEYSRKVDEYAKANNAQSTLICAKIEAEVAGLETEEEKKEFLQAVGLEETGLSKVIKTAYSLLGLSTFFTIGPKEAHAWTVKKNSFAPQAAGVIHTDFEKGFITAETIKTDDYIAYKGEVGCKTAGKVSINGKDYVVQDGDIYHFRFNV
ncbi:MAG TPA: redox-regulated ATPase YchF [Alphaproteobacteria bacterium]|nr:redox-regulated ATPase YchF [Alphaproteobacteria bacterium]